MVSILLNLQFCHFQHSQFSLSFFTCTFVVVAIVADKSPKEFLFIMAFVVPCISIFVCYARIFYIVRKTALRSHDIGSSLGNSMHCQSNRIQNHIHTAKKIYATNNNKNISDGTDIQLLPRSDDVSGDSGRIDALTLCDATRTKKHLSVNNLLDGNITALSHSQSQGDIKSSQSEHKLTVSDRNLSNVSISQTVEVIEANGERHNSCNHDDYTIKITQDAVDSAIEESISSTENNQVGIDFSCHAGIECHQCQF